MPIHISGLNQKSELACKIMREIPMVSEALRNLRHDGYNANKLDWI